MFVVVFCFSLLTGCGNSQEKILTGAEREAVLAFSEAKTDNLLAGLKAGDYAMFSRDFDQQMLNAMPQSKFEALKKERDEHLGAYISRKINNVEQTGDFYTVIYTAGFEKEYAVIVRVVFRMAEPHQISGLWFNK